MNVEAADTTVIMCVPTPMALTDALVGEDSILGIMEELGAVATYADIKCKLAHNQ